MKVLYAFQGTGNGHLSRANVLVPILQEKAEIVTAISGYSHKISADFEIDYKLSGPGFVFGDKGGIKFLESFKKTKPGKIWKEINRFPVEHFDLIISDFEPISAWAGKMKRVPVVGMSHQAAFLSPLTPRPRKRSFWGEMILQQFAPADTNIGFHFKPYDSFIETPILRSCFHENLPISDNGKVLVYLPAFSDALILDALSRYAEVQFEVFSKEADSHYIKQNCTFFPVNGKRFTERMFECAGILTGGGFETAAEALHIGKKLFVIPMRNQYEQQCNAAALKELGVTTSKGLDDKFHKRFAFWLIDTQPEKVLYPNIAEEVVSRVLNGV